MKGYGDTTTQAGRSGRAQSRLAVRCRTWSAAPGPSDEHCPRVRDARESLKEPGGHRRRSLPRRWEDEGPGSAARPPVTTSSVCAGSANPNGHGGEQAPSLGVGFETPSVVEASSGSAGGRQVITVLVLRSWLGLSLTLFAWLAAVRGTRRRMARRAAAHGSLPRRMARRSAKVPSGASRAVGELLEVFVAAIETRTVRARVGGIDRE